MTFFPSIFIYRSINVVGLKPLRKTLYF